MSQSHNLFPLLLSIYIMSNLLLSHSSESNPEYTLPLANKVILDAVVYKSSNVVISPLSFRAVLSFIALGCNGSTQQQLLRFLGSRDADGHLQSLCKELATLTSPLDESSSHGTLHLSAAPELRFANAVYLHQDYSFKPSFVENVQGVFKAESRVINHGYKVDDILSQINSWATKVSKGLITSLLNQNSLLGKTGLILSNAIYFKGKWAQKFDAFSSRKMNFYLLTGGQVNVQFMTSKERSRLFRQFNNGVKVLALPYHNGTKDPRQFSMYIFLPHQNNGLPNLIQIINNHQEFLTQDLGLEKEQLTELWIPKFKFTFDFEASKTLIEMGLTQPFIAPNQDFNEMVLSHKDETINLSKVYHKACIEVDEDGTEAVAFTTAVFGYATCGSIPRRPTATFVADHPFFFMIREETTKTVFFSGAVVNPLMS